MIFKCIENEKIFKRDLLKKDMEQQQYFMKLQGLEQEANQLGEQLKTIDQQVGEMQKLKEDLNVLKEKEEKEFFTEFGKGIFMKAKVEKSNFLVDVGKKIYVQKNHNEIEKVIENQIKKFGEIRNESSNRIAEINEELNKLIKEAKEKQDKEEKALKKQESEKKEN